MRKPLGQIYLNIITIPVLLIAGFYWFIKERIG